jgi:hypothetical protein
MGQIGREQNLLAFSHNLLSLTIMEHRRRKPANTTMVMVVVVPIEKGTAESPRILKGAESLGKLRLVFKGFELGFGKGIVIRDMRP